MATPELPSFDIDKMRSTKNSRLTPKLTYGGGSCRANEPPSNTASVLTPLPSTPDTDPELFFLQLPSKRRRILTSPVQGSRKAHLHHVARVSETDETLSSSIVQKLRLVGEGEDSEEEDDEEILKFTSINTVVTTVSKGMPVIEKI